MLPFLTASPEMLAQSSHREWDQHSTAGSCGTITDSINVPGYTASCVQSFLAKWYCVVLHHLPLSHFMLLPSPAYPLQLTDSTSCCRRRNMSQKSSIPSYIYIPSPAKPIPKHTHITTYSSVVTPRRFLNGVAALPLIGDKETWSIPENTHSKNGGKKR